MIKLVCEFKVSHFSENVAHQVFMLSPVWFDRKEGLLWKSLKKHSESVEQAGNSRSVLQVFSSARTPRLVFFSLFCVGLHWQPGSTVNEATWTRMAVNLSKNGAALMAAYKEVVDTKSDTNWWADSDDCGVGTHPDITIIISWIFTFVPSFQGAVYLWGEQ